MKGALVNFEDYHDDLSPMDNSHVNSRFSTSSTTQMGQNTDKSTYVINMTETQGSSTAPTSTPIKELTERAWQEHVEEWKLKDSSVMQLLMRGFTTFLMEFFACIFFDTAVLSTHAFSNSLSRQAITTGLMVTALLAIFARENAAHLNPLNTILLLVTGRYGLPWYFSIAHFLAQPLGAIIATLFVWAMTPGFERGLGLGTPELAPGLTPGQGFFFQFMGCLLIFTVFLWAIEASGRRNFYEQTSGDFRYNTMFILTIGISHAAAAYAFGHATGTYFDWYLYFFPGIISDTISSSDWWIWFVAPIIAAIIALALWALLHWFDEMAYQTASKRERLVDTGVDKTKAKYY